VAVTLGDGSELRAHSVILSTGVSYQRLRVPGADRLTGSGLYYGAAFSETSSVSGEHIHIVGGANSAGQAAIHFSTVAQQVTMLVRGDTLSSSMSHYLAERIRETDNIDVRHNTTVEEVCGSDRVEQIMLLNSESSDRTVEPASAIFVFIGAAPRTDWLDGHVARDARGFILTGPDVITKGNRKEWHLDRDPYLMETCIPGVFAAGDVRLGSGKRVATAVGEGATAVMSVWQYRASMGL
jgi:thioredoxin reductase (NADPH)